MEFIQEKGSRSTYLHNFLPHFPPQLQNHISPGDGSPPLPRFGAHMAVFTDIFHGFGPLLELLN